MVSEQTPVTIKKYANRRLYNTGTSAYVTLDDLGTMVKKGDDFVVYDAKTSEDITRSVLTQIIFEQESKGGQGLLPVTFLRQLIRFYGDSMQMMVPSYLEFSLDKLTKEKGGLADKYAAMFGANPLASAARPFVGPFVGQIEEQTRQNMAMFRQALSMFVPFSGAGTGAANGSAAVPPSAAPAPPTQAGAGELDEMRRQLETLQRRMDAMTPKNE